MLHFRFGLVRWTPIQAQLQINVYTQTLPVLLGLEIAKHNLFNTLEVCVKVLFSLTYNLTGRYDNIPRDERLSSLCNCNKIEDETHLLLDGPIFSSIRNMFLN